MVQSYLNALLIGAGASLVAALPAPPAPYAFPSSESEGCEVVYVTEYASSKTAGPVGTGTGYPAYPGNATSTYMPTGSGAISVPLSTGYSASSSATVSSSAPAYSSSAAAASSVAPVYTSSVAVSSAAAYSSPAAAAISPVVKASVSASSDCTFIDVDAAVAGKANCDVIELAGIAVPAETTLDMSDLADGTTVIFSGKTTFEYAEWEGPLIRVSGTSITVQAADGAIIDGNGSAWWDGEGSNGGVDKPKMFYAHDLIDSTIQGLTIQNYPVQCMSINEVQNSHFIDLTIDNSAAGELGHNTDAFDVGSSTGVYISGAVVKNQDDCLAINSGSDISFTGGSCSGGHGLSIGSVGGRDDNDVSNVYIADSTVSDSDNGLRIKTVYDATGSVNNITYSNMKLENIAKYGIIVEQDYENGSPTGEPTDGVPVTDVTFDGVTGTMSDGNPVFILCAACSDWSWSGVDITGGEVSDECAGVPSGASC